MKTLRHTCAATMLTLALAVSALGGEIHCPGAPTGTASTGSITTTVILTIIGLIR